MRTLQDFFAGSGLEGVVVEPHPGRASLIVRIEGTDPAEAVTRIARSRGTTVISPERRAYVDALDRVVREVIGS